MKRITLLIPILILTIDLIGETIQVSEKLNLVQLTDKTYMHTCENNNGMVFINGGDALIVSTPDSDTETQNLINWVTKGKNAKIVGYVIDRWHPDAMEGLDVVHKNGIETHAYELTRQISKEKGLPIPQTGFNPKTEIQVGDEKVICHYLGEAHTRDGIVVYIPSEEVLFGGNEIRNFNGWIGNIGDARLNKWAATAKRIKDEYGSAKFVIPGHGKHGGNELIDYTIRLYAPFEKELSERIKKAPLDARYITNNEFYYSAETITADNGIKVLHNGFVVAQDSSKYVQIESPRITYEANNKRIDSDTGRLLIYDKVKNDTKLRTEVRYNRLILFKIDDEVGLRVILRGIEN